MEKIKSNVRDKNPDMRRSLIPLILVRPCVMVRKFVIAIGVLLIMGGQLAFGQDQDRKSVV